MEDSKAQTYLQHCGKAGQTLSAAACLLLSLPLSLESLISRVVSTAHFDIEGARNAAKAITQDYCLPLQHTHTHYLQHMGQAPHTHAAQLREDNLVLLKFLNCHEIVIICSFQENLSMFNHSSLKQTCTLQYYMCPHTHITCTTHHNAWYQIPIIFSKYHLMSTNYNIYGCGIRVMMEKQADREVETSITVYWNGFL